MRLCSRTAATGSRLRSPYAALLGPTGSAVRVGATGIGTICAYQRRIWSEDRTMGVANASSQTRPNQNLPLRWTASAATAAMFSAIPAPGS